MQILKTLRGAAALHAIGPGIANAIRAALHSAFLRVRPIARAIDVALHSAETGAVLNAFFGLRTTLVHNALLAWIGARIDRTRWSTTHVVLTNSGTTLRGAITRRAIGLADRTAADAVVAHAGATFRRRSALRTIWEALLKSTRERVRIAHAAATAETVFAGSTIRPAHRVEADPAIAEVRTTFGVAVAPEVVRQAASEPAGVCPGITDAGTTLEVVDAEVAIGLAPSEDARVCREVTRETAALHGIGAESSLGYTHCLAAGQRERIAKTRAALRICRAAQAVLCAAATTHAVDALLGTTILRHVASGAIASAR